MSPIQRRETEPRNELPAAELASLVSEQDNSCATLVEAYPFRKRLAEVMEPPPASCSIDTECAEAARLLLDSGDEALLVIAEGRMAGILTPRELLRALLPTAAATQKTGQVGEVMAAPPPALSPDSYLYEAIALMQRRTLQFLAVCKQGEPVGLITPATLIRYRGRRAMMLLGSIGEEQTLAGLAEIRREGLAVARSLLGINCSAPQVMENLSHIHLAIIKRVFELCLDKRASASPPPGVRYCLLALGSGGRREMLLAPDQDHALLYEELSAERLAEAEEFFAPLMEEFAAALEEVGYPRCAGGVMAGNPDWRGRLNDWRGRIREWIAEGNSARVLASSIFFDLAPLAGDPELCAELRSLAKEEVHGQSTFLYQMMSLDQRGKVPLGLLGRFVTERGGDHAGRLSLKLGGMLYLVDCIRMFALDKGLTETGTLARLHSLTAAHVFDRETAEHLEAAFKALSFLRLRLEIDCLEEDRPADHYIDPASYSKNEQELLREALQAVSRLQDATRKYFARTPF